MTRVRGSLSSLWPPVLELSRTNSERGTHVDQPNSLDHGGRTVREFCADRGKRLLEALVDVRSPSGTKANRREAKEIHPNSAIGTSIANPHKIIWVRPDDVVFKTCCDHDLRPNDVKPGDWDLERVLVDDSAKYRSIRQRYVEGVSWEETELFKDYAARLRAGEVIRGADSLLKLKRQYEAKVDPLFRDFCARGFLIERDKSGRPKNLPHVHISRDGQILFGTKGNHRLSMAKLLSLKSFPCQVWTRHSEWQTIRDTIASDGADSFLKRHQELRRHPDLIDLIYPNQ